MMSSAALTGLSSIPLCCSQHGQQEAMFELDKETAVAKAPLQFVQVAVFFLLAVWMWLVLRWL